MSSTSGNKRYRSEDDNAGGGRGNAKPRKKVKTVFSGFWDEGVVAEDGRIDYTGLNLTIGKDVYEVRVGDTVILRGDDGPGKEDADSKGAGSQAAIGGSQKTGMTEAKVGDGLMLARVERIWQEKSRGGRSGKILFQARWFLKKEDVDSLPVSEITGPIAPEQFVKSITEHDLVLSNQSDDNHVTTISGLIQVLYRNPNADTTLPSHILPTTYICRYSLSIGESPDKPAVEVLPYAGENDEWHEMTIAAVQRKLNNSSDEEEDEDQHRTGYYENNSSIDASEGDSGSEISFQSPSKRKRGGRAVMEDGIDEGTTEERYIQVGRDYQVFVPPFVPNQRSVSRHPKMVWKPGMIEQDAIDTYIDEATRALTPFLRERRWTHEEPYAPFPSGRLEELSKSLSQQHLPTLSSVSTVASLATKSVEALREIDTDALLTNLHSSLYDVKKALTSVTANPSDFLTIWTPQEKNVFDTGFRRYNGSLRAIYKGMGTKDLQDVIDYHYRFKIPDQFRRFQERKREQAVRMLECIETRRSLNTAILMPTNLRPASAEDKRNWYKTSSSNANISVEERRMKAKELLLDVEAQLGKSKSIQLFKAIKDAPDNPLVESKTRILELLRGHRDFQTRFLEFLPHQLRL